MMPLSYSAPIMVFCGVWCVVATPVLEFSSNMARLELQRRKNLYSCPPTSPRAQVFLVCPLTPSAAFLRSNLMEPPSTSAVTCGCLASRAHLSDDRLFLKVHPKGDGRTSNAILDPLPYFFLSAAYLQYMLALAQGGVTLRSTTPLEILIFQI